MTDDQYNARKNMFGNGESWELSVPPELQLAVEGLREAFDKVHWESNTITEKSCFSSLHKDTSDDFVKDYGEPLKYLKMAAGFAALQRHQELVKQNTLPAIFRAFLDLYVDSVTPPALVFFGQLVEIGRMNQAVLPTGYLEWAEAQTKNVIRSQAYRIELWIKRVCDIQPLMQDEEFDEWIFWRKWQAPQFIVMHPSRSKPYDVAAVWERSDLETTDRWLMSFGQAYVLHLEDELKTMAGAIAVAIAKSPRLAAPQAPNIETANAHPSNEPASSRSGRAIRNKAPRKLSRLELRRRSVMFGALQNNLEGRSYCLELDKRKLSVPQAWLDEGCPKTYSAAYVAAGSGWQKRIQDEKSRFKIKYDRTSPAERERLIEQRP